MLNYLKQPNEFTKYLTFGDLNQAKGYPNFNKLFTMIFMKMFSKNVNSSWVLS